MPEVDLNTLKESIDSKTIPSMDDVSKHMNEFEDTMKRVTTAFA